VSYLSRNTKTVIGMIHVQALPGTPRCGQPLESIVERARTETRMYAEAGVDGVMIENMHDVPYLNGQVGPEITAAMTATGFAVRAEWLKARPEYRTPSSPDERADLPLGVQILAAANREALATALACGASFIRAENFAYAHVADEGLMPTAEAGPLLRYRRQIGAEHIRILADVKKKHSSHALTADISLDEAARAIEFFGADGVVVTGAATGTPASLEDAATVRKAVDIPVAIGSGLTPKNLPGFWAHADIFIVGSYVKRGDVWSNEIDPERLTQFMSVAHALRDRA